MGKEIKVRRRSDIGERTVARMKAGRNGIIEATYRMDIVEFRVFLTMLTMITPDDLVFCEYELRVADIIRVFGLNRDGRSYESIKEAAERLVNKTMVIYHTKEDGNRYRTVIPFLTSASSQLGDSKSESIRVTFHPELKPFLLRLRSEYLEFDVRNIAQLQSQYSIRLYMMLRHQMNLKKTSVTYTVERLREIFEILPSEYPLYGNFKQKVLARACNDLNAATNIRIERFEEERSNRKVVAVVFHMSSQEIPVNQPVETSDKPAELMLTKSATAAKKTRKVIELDDAATEQVVDQLHRRVEQYISREAIQTWLHQVSEEQVRSAIEHTVAQLKKGVRIRNVGGYLHKMVNTSLPLSFEQPAESPVAPKRQAATAQQQQQVAEEARFAALTEAKFGRALQTLDQHAEWQETVIEYMRSGLFGRFYQENLGLHENLKNPALCGPFFTIMERLEPAIFRDIGEQ